MAEKSWFNAFKESMNIIFTKKDFENYLAACRENLLLYRRYLKENAKILDIGCGLGVGSVPLSTLGYKVIGIDNDMDVVEAARTNAENFGKDIEIIFGDVFAIDELFGKDSFDACISGGLLEHFSEAQIKELIKKQLIVAPIMIASMPIAAYYGEVWDDGVQRNLWESKYWLDNILNIFNIAEYKVKKASNSIGGFIELEVVIKR